MMTGAAAGAWKWLFRGREWNCWRRVMADSCRRKTAMNGGWIFPGSTNSRKRLRGRIPADGSGVGTASGIRTFRNVFRGSVSRPTNWSRASELSIQISALLWWDGLLRSIQMTIRLRTWTMAAFLLVCRVDAATLMTKEKALGRVLPTAIRESLMVSPDARHVGYVALRGGKWLVVHDG